MSSPEEETATPSTVTSLWPYLEVRAATRGPLAKIRKIMMELVRAASPLPTWKCSLILGSSNPKE